MFPFSILLFLLPFFPFQLSAVSNFSNTADKTFIPAESDWLHFGRIWPSIRDSCQQNEINALIRARRVEIKEIKEHWRDRISDLETGSLKEFYKEIDAAKQAGQFKRIDEGGGSAYLLLDEQEKPRFIVKPIDEDLLCLNNCKFYGNPFNLESIRVRSHIPLYRSHQTDALSYEVACIIDLPKITPKAIIGIVNSPLFFDLSDISKGKEKEEFLEAAGTPDKEKLCSIQEFISNAPNLIEIVENWLNEELSEDEIASRIDRNDFEDANIFVWTIYDNDAHAGNFLFYEKAEDEAGNKIYGMIKIDNGLGFPEKNSSLQNFLRFLPNANQELSQRGKDTIAKISIQKIKEKMCLYEMDNSFEACEKRIRTLQQLAQKEHLEIYDIDLRMKMLEFEDGEDLALSDLPKEEFEKIVWKKSSENPFTDD
jgi:hypothetical protein